jgi:predicted nucleic acid-binding protein
VSLKALLDTGPIVALLNRADQHHEKCLEFMTTAPYEFITCEPVITEACFILRSNPRAIDDVLRNVDDAHFQIAYSVSRRAAEIRRLMAKYSDQQMSLADACLVDMAFEQQFARIATVDGDFQAYRWGRNQAFELLIDL